MFLTITIQTYNRAEVLAVTLESLRELRCPTGIDYEILVVNNNSTDHTEEIISRYTAVFAPRLRSVFEAKQGLSHARNRALKESRGQIVCFLDDDVKVNPGWLEAVADAFKKYSPAVVGGRSYLIFPCVEPRWLPETHQYLLSRLDYGDQTIVNTDRDLFGLNFSVRKDWAIKVGGFDTALGRSGNLLLSGEESDLLARLRNIGGVAVYEPKAVVGHMVSAERLTPKWFFRRVYANTTSHEYIAFRDGHRGSICGALARLLYAIACMVIRVLQGQVSQRALFLRSMSVTSALARFTAIVRLKFRHAFASSVVTTKGNGDRQSEEAIRGQR